MSEELRRKLKDARAKLGLSQAQFAKQIGMPRGTLIKWENDQSTPQGLSLKLINAMLDKILSDTGN
jgi:putative transcriptional regulator